MGQNTFLVNSSVEVNVPLYVFPLPSEGTLSLLLGQNLLPILQGRETQRDPNGAACPPPATVSDVCAAEGALEANTFGGKGAPLPPAPGWLERAVISPPARNQGRQSGNPHKRAFFHPPGCSVSTSIQMLSYASTIEIVEALAINSHLLRRCWGRSWMRSWPLDLKPSQKCSQGLV